MTGTQTGLSMNRKRRKQIARTLKEYLLLDRIPQATTENIVKLCRQAGYKDDYEKYANW